MRSYAPATRRDGWEYSWSASCRTEAPHRSRHIGEGEAGTLLICSGRTLPVSQELSRPLTRMRPMRRGVDMTGRGANRTRVRRGPLARFFEGTEKISLGLYALSQPSGLTDGLDPAPDSRPRRNRSRASQRQLINGLSSDYAAAETPSHPSAGRIAGAGYSDGMFDPEPTGEATGCYPVTGVADPVLSASCAAGCAPNAGS